MLIHSLTWWCCISYINTSLLPWRSSVLVCRYWE